MSQPNIAVLVPCYNEASTVQSVVSSFRAALPDATIYVYDNNSTDGTSAAAVRAGAVVRDERQQGKGNVIRRMFADIEADAYVLVDGDDTYDPSVAKELVDQLLSKRLDFINVARKAKSKGAYRLGHTFGNKLLTGLVRAIFGKQFQDMLSGYKIFSRRFVKSFPAMARGFETETELVVHALELRMPTHEVVADYAERPAGSFSKLNTYRDGTRILRLIINLIKDERPLLFFGAFGTLVILCGLALSGPVILQYFQAGDVPRLPTAILALGLITIGLLSFMTGLILDLATRTRHEIKRLAYLSIPVYDKK